MLSWVEPLIRLIVPYDLVGLLAHPMNIVTRNVEASHLLLVFKLGGGSRCEIG